MLLPRQDPSHWEAVVDSLELEPKQAYEIVQLYREYVQKLVLAKRDRTAAAKAVQEVRGVLLKLVATLPLPVCCVYSVFNRAGMHATCGDVPKWALAPGRKPRPSSSQSTGCSTSAAPPELLGRACSP